MVAEALSSSLVLPRNSSISLAMIMLYLVVQAGWACRRK
jgi:hypothetical protein